MLKPMPNLEIEDVPDYVIETLSRRAKRQGLSLPVYVWTLLVRAAESPDEVREGVSDELFNRMASREPSGLTTEEIVAMIRKTRDA